jgi:catechol 2,3-dioxygenase-like lactoylglutathione lyase family enzyme
VERRLITNLNHVGLSVQDLDRSVAFYTGMFGMEVVIDRRFEGERYERILAVQGATGRVALLRREGIQLELFEFEHPKPRSSDRSSVVEHGITHFCLEVTDLTTFYERLTDAGVHFLSSPVDFKGEAKAVYALDPDGNVFELWERAEAASTDGEQRAVEAK